MITVFISQPMNGKTEEEILKERQAAVDMVKGLLDKYFDNLEVQVIDSYFKNTVFVKPLSCLAQSLELMAHADLVVFAPGWENARGCKIEHECAIQYGIRTLHLGD